MRFFYAFNSSIARVTPPAPLIFLLLMGLGDTQILYFLCILCYNMYIQRRIYYERFRSFIQRMARSLL
nr:MAG TPA: hypothetical protein [Microviridae sp.]